MSEQTLPEQKLPEPQYLPESDPKKSHEERLNLYLSKRSGKVRINDFLKSLYPVVKMEPPKWKDQAESKKIRALLTKLEDELTIAIPNNTHLKLGKHFYDYNDKNQVTQYHDLGNTPIEVEVI